MEIVQWIGQSLLLERANLGHFTLAIIVYMSFFGGGGGGGGATRELTEVLAVSADFSEYCVPKGGGGYVIPFRKALEKRFSEMYGLGGGAG